MANLPSDRTKLNAAVANQQPSVVASAKANREALIESYDTIDLLNQKTDGLVAGGNLVPFPPANISRQAIINGNFDIWQRGTNIASSAMQAYSADRWNTFRGGFTTGLVTTRQDGTGVPGSEFCARVQRQGGISSINTITIGQAIESKDSIKLRGQKVTLSFYARKGADYSSTNSLLNVFVITGNGTDQNISGGFTGSTNIGSSNVTLTTSWQKFTVTTSIISTSSTQLGVTFSYSPNGVAGADDYFELVQVQINAGEAALPFQPRTFAEELELCQRYFEKSYNYDASIGALTSNGCENVVASTSYLLSKQDVRFKVRKRVAPTIGVYSPQTGAFSQVAEFSASSTFVSDRSTGASAQSETSFQVASTSGNYTTGNFERFHWAADAEL